MKRRIAAAVFWLIPLPLMGLIFYFSSPTAQESTATSRSLGGALLRLLTAFLALFGRTPAPTLTAESIDFFLRKCAHFSIYGALGGSLYHAVRFGGKPRRKQKLLALLISFCYAVSDEFHQWFVSGRSAEVRDIAIDTLGAMLGILFVALLWRTVLKKLQK